MDSSKVTRTLQKLDIPDCLLTHDAYLNNWLTYGLLLLAAHILCLSTVCACVFVSNFSAANLCHWSAWHDVSYWLVSYSLAMLTDVKPYSCNRDVSCIAALRIDVTLV